MPELYKVTFNVGSTYGYIAYDQAEKSVSVHYPDQATVATIQKWLSEEHEINTPDKGGSTTDFSPKRYLAARSLHDFETVLTRIWQHTGIHIDWSLPSEYI